jgi:hypothetical protein
MKEYQYTKLLSEDQVKYFTEFSDEHIYNTLTQIIYYGQIPMAAYLLLEGKITLLDAQKRKVKECYPKTLFGFSEIYYDKPFKYTAEISPNSKVLILHSSAILEIQKKINEENKSLEISDLFTAMG